MMLEKIKKIPKEKIVVGLIIGTMSISLLVSFCALVFNWSKDLILLPAYTLFLIGLIALFIGMYYVGGILYWGK